MDQNDFHQLLISLNSPDNLTRTNAEKILNDFMKSNYLSYLELLVFFMYNSDSQFIQKQCVTYLFKTARRDPPFLSIEVLNFLWPKLQEHYSDILVSPTFPPEAKNLFCSIISICASFSYKISESTDIQMFLLFKLQENPELVPYVAVTLNELFIAAGSTCGITLHDILLIISSDISNLTNIGLFFATASLAPQEEILHESFTKIIASVQPNSISEFLKIVMNFAEKSASFFDPHLKDFTNYLCAIALNKGLQIERIYAMMCMASIARGAPQMCQMSNSRFLFPVIHCLISIIAEITDDSNWGFDPNDIQPYVIAKDTFGTVSKECGNSNFFNFFINLMNDVFSKPNQPWEIIYAFVAALAELDTSTLSLLINTQDRNNDQVLPVVQITMQIMPFIKDLNCHPRIRQASFQVITQLCRWIGPYYQREAGNYVLPPLKDLIFKETHPITRKSVIICLTAFFSTLTSKDLIEDFDRTFNELISMLKTAPFDLKPLIAKCLGFILKAGGSHFLNYFPVMAETMQDLLQSPNISLQICAIEAFAISYYQIKVPNECMDSCKIFLSAVIKILKSGRNDLSEKMIDSCKMSICILIKRLESNFIEFADDILPEAINSGGASIEVTTVGAMEFTNEGFSFQMQIPTISVSGVKQFVNKADVQSICKALDIINEAEKAMKQEFIPYLDPTIKIAQQWLSSQYHIEPIKINSCNILRSAILVAFTNNNALSLIELITDLYLQNITPISSQKFLKTLLLMIQDAFFSPYIQGLDQEIKINVLSTIPQIIELTLDRKVKIINDRQQWQTLGIYDKAIDKQDEVLIEISNFLKLCFQNIPELMIPFFQQKMMLKFFEYIQQPESQTLALLVWSEYLITSKDQVKLQQFLPTLFSFASMKNLDLSPIAFDVIGNMFQCIEFESVDIENCYNFFKEEMLKPYIVDQDFSLIADHALIALTKIIMYHPKELKKPDVLSFWFEMLPIWDASDICDLVYAFLASLLEEGNPYILNEENFERIITLISSRAFSDFMEESTSIRFSNFIKSMAQTAGYSELMQSAYNSLNESNKTVFNKLLNYPEG